MPADALPAAGKKRGKLSYTIEDPGSVAKVEVLLKHQAFRVVRVAEASPSGSLR